MRPPKQIKADIYRVTERSNRAATNTAYLQDMKKLQELQAEWERSIPMGKPQQPGSHQTGDYTGVHTMKNIFADAIEVQNASNLSGVLRSWLTSLDQIKADGYKEGIPFSEHPVNVLFADKVFSMTGRGRKYLDAYHAAKAKAEGAQ